MDDAMPTSADIDCAQAIVFILGLSQEHVLTLAEFRSVAIAEAKKDLRDVLVKALEEIQLSMRPSDNPTVCTYDCGHVFCVASRALAQKEGR